MSKAAPQKVAVLGAGPIGLEAALYAKSAGLAVAVYDRGAIADHVRRWGHVRMFTPFGMNATSLGLKTLLREKGSRSLPAPGDTITGREFRDAYLVPIGESELLLESLHLEHTVLHVGRAARGFRLLVRAANGAERIDTADAVLDCTGTFGTPRWLGDAGIPAVGELAARPHIAFGVEDVLGDRKDHYAGRSVALIGDGYSAATSICALATLAEEHHATWVFWITRGARGQPLPRVATDPYKERDRLAVRANSLATRCDGNLEFHPQTVLDEVTSHGPDKGFRIAGRSNGKPVSWEVERVIANIGYRPDATLGASDPNYVVLGAKASDTSFLLRTGFDQIRQALAALTGNPRLDLYDKKAA
ncbi:NAD(P)-binding domain-containing protein [Gemmata sp.]|uniref:NAD(P)-binding domain-containing protein n=1 Tax=Gemmata sp. TaxID=1914242 RepID=UPI003F71B69F